MTENLSILQYQERKQHRRDNRWRRLSVLLMQQCTCFLFTTINPDVNKNRINIKAAIIRKIGMFNAQLHTQSVVKLKYWQCCCDREPAQTNQSLLVRLSSSGSRPLMATLEVSRRLGTNTDFPHFCQKPDVPSIHRYITMCTTSGNYVWLSEDTPEGTGTG